MHFKHQIDELLTIFEPLSSPTLFNNQGKSLNHNQLLFLQLVITNKMSFIPFHNSFIFLFID